MRSVPLSVIVVGSDEEEELLLIGRGTRILVNVTMGIAIFFLLTYLVLVLRHCLLSSFSRSVAVCLRWQLKHSRLVVTVQMRRCFRFVAIEGGDGSAWYGAG